MTLNAQERAAVEASARLIDHPDPRFYAMQAEARKFHKDSLDARLTVYITLGHLSGFRAGVEAALKEAVLADSIEEARYEIRALLAQEDEHGS